MIARTLAAILILFVIGSCDSVDELAPNEEDVVVSEDALSKGGRNGHSADRVEICHRKKRRGTYVKKRVPQRALKGHLRHGDGLPGDWIPQMDGHEFDDSCQPQPSPCLCWSSNELQAIAEKPFVEIWYDGYSESIFRTYMGNREEVHVWYGFPFAETRICSYVVNHEAFRFVEDIAHQDALRCRDSILQTGIACSSSPPEWANLCPE